MDHDMTLDPGTSRRLRDWLHETAEELPHDPALFADIKAGLRAPRSRPWGWPSRTGSRRAVAVSLVATVAITVVGLAFRGPDRDGRAPAIGAAPAPSAMPLPTGVIPPGRYGFGPDLTPLTERYDVTFDAPEGWSNWNGGWVLDRDGGDPPAGATFEVFSIEQIQADPCDTGAAVIDLPLDAGLAAAVEPLQNWGSDALPRTPTKPIPSTLFTTDGTVDGRPYIELDIRTPLNIDLKDCGTGRYVLWQDRKGNQRWIQGAGEVMRVRAIDLGTEPLFLAAGSFPDTPAEVLAEQQVMLDSVRIVERPAPSPGPSSPSPSMAVLPKFEARLAAGRYRVDPRWLALGDGYAVSVEVPAGWHMQSGNLTHGSGYERRDTQVDFWAIDRIYMDPCIHDGYTDRRPWFSLDGFAGSLTGWWPSSAPTSPVTTTPRFADYAGYPGFELTATIPADVDVSTCAEGIYFLWDYADQSGRQAGARDELLIRVLAVDPAPQVPGAIPDAWRSGFLSIVASTQLGTPPEAREELLGIVDSVRIERLETPASPSPVAP